MKRHFSHGLAFFVILVGTLIQGGQYGSAHAANDFQISINGIDSTTFPEIQSHISILDPNGVPYSGLLRNDFKITEDGKPVTEFDVQEVEESASPITFVIAVDTSGSMSGKPLLDTTEAISTLVKSLNDQDQIAVVTFDDQPMLVVPVTNDHSKLDSALTGLDGSGKTALWDGIHLSLNTLFSFETGRSAVIVVSDGADTTSLMRIADVVTEANVHHIPVFSIGFGEVDKNSLLRLSKLTGGETFILPDTTTISNKFDDILKTMRPEYVLSYKSLALADGMEHQVAISVNIQNSSLQTESLFTIPAVDLTISLRGISDGARIGIGNSTLLSPEFPSSAAISKVEYVLDDLTLAELTSPPFEYEWTPLESAAGSHTLNIRAYDLVGNKVEEFFTIQVDPAIVIQILQPVDAEKIADEIPFEIDVNGIADITSVEIYLDNQLIKKLVQKPYVFSYLDNSITPGSHTILVKAGDIDGNTAEETVEIEMAFPIQWIIAGIAAGLVVTMGLVILLSFRNRNRIRRVIVRQDRMDELVGPEDHTSDPAIIVVKKETRPAAPVRGATEAAVPFARIFLRNSQSDEEQVYKIWHDITWLGSDRSDQSIRLSEPGLPQKLALIQISEQKCQLVPLNFAVPIILNGRPLTEAIALDDRDEIVIGNDHLIIYLA